LRESAGYIPHREAVVKKSRFTEEQIIAVLKQVEGGLAVTEVCRQRGISEQTYYRWRAKFGGLEASEAKRLRELEHENAKLKRLVADLSLDCVALKDALSGKYNRP
jgi:putative transposase